jgi:hypothetical protein
MLEVLEKIKEIGVAQSDLIKSFAIFYLLLIGNHIDRSVFTCFQINYLEKHKWLQLTLAFFLFYFLVTSISDTGKLEFIPPIEKLIYSIIYFIMFLIVMRLDMRITAVVLALIYILFFIETNKVFYQEIGVEITDDTNKQIYDDNHYWLTFNWPYKIRLFRVKDEHFVFLNKVEALIFYTIIFLLIIGFISYGGEIHDTVKNSKDLTWLDLITDTNICKLKDRKSFWHYFKVGLGFKN